MYDIQDLCEMCNSSNIPFSLKMDIMYQHKSYFKDLGPSMIKKIFSTGIHLINNCKHYSMCVCTEMLHDNPLICTIFVFSYIMFL